MKAISGVWIATREDAEFACRSLARVPTYTSTLIVTLALAIGGITAVFSVLYAVVLRPLPFPRAQELVALHTYYDRVGRARGPSSPSEFIDLQRQNQSFSKLAALSYGDVNVTGLARGAPGEAVHVSGATVSADFFRLLGLPPVLGRDFAPGEDQPGAPAVASYQTGTSPTPHDIWWPLVFDERHLGARGRNTRFIQVFGRLRPDVTFAAASADIDRIVESFYREFPSSYQRETGFRMYLEPLHDYTARMMRGALWLSFGAVTLVLLAACANAASLSLARLASRRREIAVRTALGATAGRIGLQFLVESVIIALGAGALGLVIGRAGMDGLLALSPATRINIDVSFQAPVFAFAVGVSGLSEVIAGAAPAWHAARFSPTSGLREGGRATNAGAGRLRSGLVVAQVTVALVLLVCAAMMLRSVAQLTTESPGFEPRDVYVAQLSLNKVRYQDDGDRRRFADALLERLRATPGIEAVGLTDTLLFADWDTRKVQIEGDPEASPINQAQVRMVGGDYFNTLRLELVAGRFLAASDSEDSPKVGVISELTANKYFSGRNPLGMRLIFRQLGGQSVPFTIVGIVADTREVGLGKPIEPYIYVPFDQWPNAWIGIAVRAPKLGASALSAIRAARPPSAS